MSTDRVGVVDAIERQDIDERQTALRALLRHPLLTSAGPDPEAFTLVRRHARWLREWFAAEAGWTLQIDSGLARLRKVPANVMDATRPAQADRSGAPFSRRRYALLCLVLAALARAEAQVTLGSLAEATRSLANDAAFVATGVSLFTLGSREDRSDLVVVIRLLLGLHVLAKVAGDEQAFVNTTGDALYDVNRRALAGLLVAQRGPSLVRERDFEARLLALTQEPPPDSEEARQRALRHALTRRLVDDPVVYFDDLSPDERNYLNSQRPFLPRRLSEATGMLPEVRAEGLAFLDGTAEATDLRMPEEGTDGHATLLLADYLAGVLKERGEVTVRMTHIQTLMAGWTREHRAHWRMATREPGAEVSLSRMAVDRLEALQLVRTTDDGVIPKPALARFAYQPAPVIQTPEVLA